MRTFLQATFSVIMILFSLCAALPSQASAASARTLSRDGLKALNVLLAESDKARTLAKDAKGILIFPTITKAGFLVGGQYGEGVLFKDGKPGGFYNTVAVSYGLQVGAQQYGYALFFMSDAAMKYLDKSDGWELGSAPSIVVIDEGVAGGISTTSAQSDMYAFFFGQKGLMAGLGLQGTKITKIDK